MTDPRADAGRDGCSSIDRSYIRVKAMLIAPNTDGTRHLVSRNAPSSENPQGYDRFVGGSVELGETHREAIIREVDEELGAEIRDLAFIGMVENIFHLNGELGHEIVALYSGRLDPEPPTEGGTLTEIDGSVVPVVWRPFDDADETVPLYPAVVSDRLRAGTGMSRAPRNLGNTDNAHYVSSHDFPPSPHGSR